MNILVTLNVNYLHPLTVMLKSLAVNNPGDITVYVLSRDLTQKHLDDVDLHLGEPDIHLVLRHVDESVIKRAPTSSRYPMAMYDRLFAASYLPDSLGRILYLDPDVIILHSLDKLWSMPLGDNYYAAASHTLKVGDLYNSMRIDAGGMVPYFNSGVLLMNLDALRKHQDPAEVISYIITHRGSLMLPDQDILTALYGKKIIPLDPYIYNMTERLLNRAAFNPESDIDAQWVFEHSAIIHYIGRNKPWKEHYKGKLGIMYRKYEDLID